MHRIQKTKLWRSYADSGFITAPLILILLLLMSTMIVIMLNTRAVRLKILAVQDSLAAATLAGAIPSVQEFQNGEGVYIPQDKVDDSYDAFLESMKTNLSLTLEDGTTDTFIPASSMNGSMKSIQVIDYRVYSVTVNKDSSRQIKEALSAGKTSDIPAQYLDITEYHYVPSKHGQANAIQSTTYYPKAIVYNPDSHSFISATPVGYPNKVVSPNGKDITRTAIYADVKPKFESSIRAMNAIKIDNEVPKVSGIVENFTSQLILYQGLPSTTLNTQVSKEVMGSYYFKPYSKDNVEIASDGTDIIYLSIATSGSAHDETIRKIADVMKNAWVGKDKNAVVNGYKVDYNTADDSATSVSQLENCRYGFNVTVNQVYNAIRKGARTIEIETKWKAQNVPTTGTPGVLTVVWYNDGGARVAIQNFTSACIVAPNSSQLTASSVDGKNFFAWSTSPDITQTSSFKSFSREYKFSIKQDEINAGKIITLYSLYK